MKETPIPRDRIINEIPGADLAFACMRTEDGLFIATRKNWPDRPGIMLDFPVISTHGMSSAEGLVHRLGRRLASSGINDFSIDPSPLLADQTFFDTDKGERDIRSVFFGGTVVQTELPKNFVLLSPHELVYYQQHLRLDSLHDAALEAIHKDRQGDKFVPREQTSRSFHTNGQTMNSEALWHPFEQHAIVRAA